MAIKILNFKNEILPRACDQNFKFSGKISPKARRINISFNCKVLNFTLNFKGKNLKYLTQFTIILAISFVAEILAALTPVKIPASIYGLIIMLLALIFKLIKVAQIRETVSFFMQIMPVIFIPAGAAIIIADDKLRESFFAIVAITAISTVAVIAASGSVTQIFYKIALNRLKRKLYAAAHNEFSEAVAPADRGASGVDSVIGGAIGGIANGVTGGGTDSAADKSVPDGADGSSVDTDALKGSASADVIKSSASADTSIGSANMDTIAGITSADTIGVASANAATNHASADTIADFASDGAITESASADAIADSADAGEIIDEMLKHEALSQEDER